MNTPLQKNKKNVEAIAPPVDAKASYPTDAKASYPTDAITHTHNAIAAPDPSPLTERPSPLYSTEQYRALGIPHCAMCGEKARTGMYGEAICAVGKTDCVRISK